MKPSVFSSRGKTSAFSRMTDGQRLAAFANMLTWAGHVGMRIQSLQFADGFRFCMLYVCASFTAESSIVPALVFYTYHTSAFLTHAPSVQASLTIRFARELKHEQDGVEPRVDEIEHDIHCRCQGDEKLEVVKQEMARVNIDI